MGRGTAGDSGPSAWLLFWEQVPVTTETSAAGGTGPPLSPPSHQQPPWEGQRHLLKREMSATDTPHSPRASTTQGRPSPAPRGGGCWLAAPGSALSVPPSSRGSSWYFCPLLSPELSATSRSVLLQRPQSLPHSPSGCKLHVQSWIRGLPTAGSGPRGSPFRLRRLSSPPTPKPAVPQLLGLATPLPRLPATARWLNRVPGSPARRQAPVRGGLKRNRPDRDFRAPLGSRSPA